MLTRPYRYLRMHMVLVGLGALPFVVWRFSTRNIWPDVSVAAYLLTAVLFLTLLNGYPGHGSRWYWKLVTVMVIVHIVVLSLFVLGTFTIVAAGIKPPTAMFFGLVIVILAVESWVALRVIRMFLERTPV
jgi:hypothetical protein